MCEVSQENLRTDTSTDDNNEIVTSILNLWFLNPEISRIGAFCIVN